MALRITGATYIGDDTMDDKTFDELMDELDANIKRIQAEIVREEAAFVAGEVV